MVQILFWKKKSLNVPTVKLFSYFFFNVFWGGFNAFLFLPLVKGKKIFIGWLVTCYCKQMVPKIRNKSKEEEVFANWSIEGADHLFNKNWL